MEKRGKEIILLVLAAALLVVLVMTFVRRSAAPTPVAAEPAVTQNNPQATAEAAEALEEPQLPSAKELLGRSPGSSAKRNPFSSPGNPVVVAKPVTPEQTSKPAENGALPTMILPGGEEDQTGVLTLKGIIRGDRTLAILRRGDTHYFVGPGGRLDNNYVVSHIGVNSVTLRANDNNIILHLGGGR